MVKGIINSGNLFGLTSDTYQYRDTKTAVKWQPVLLPGMLVLLPTLILSSKYLLPAKKLIINTDSVQVSQPPLFHLELTPF